MSAVVLTRPAPSRIVSVIRMQLANRQTYLWIPLIVLGGALVLTLAIYAILAGAGLDGPKYGGGFQAPLWYFLVVGVQSLTLTFPFSQAMSVSRREFFVGTLLTAAITAAMLAVLAVIGGLVERATDGWGMQGYFFWSAEVWAAGPLGVLLLVFVTAMLFFVTGFWGATISKRFGALGLTLVLLAVGAALVGALWIVGRLDAWAELFAWIGAQGVVGSSLWIAALVVALAGAAFLTLRRAVP